MSHQTGIQANADLKKCFSKCRDSKIRVIKINIENEQLTLAKYNTVKGTWEQDFDNYVPDLIVEDQPCYVLFRLDSTNSLGHEWLLLSWSPDSAPVRQKMLYASTKATLKQEFGSAHIKDEMHATVKEEMTLKGYKAHVTGDNTPAPLTDREEALKELSLNDHNTGFGTDTRQSTMGGVAFPMTKDVPESIIELKKGKWNYLQFKIDAEKERIELCECASVGAGEVCRRVPNAAARYHLYRFAHTHQGEPRQALVFIYSMPGYSCSIKERMLYSSCKGQFLQDIEKLGLDIAKRLEIEDGSELSEEFLYEAVHPSTSLQRPAFAKPKGPPNRGAKRITKPQATH